MIALGQHPLAGLVEQQHRAHRLGTLQLEESRHRLEGVSQRLAGGDAGQHRALPGLEPLRQLHGGDVAEEAGEGTPGLGRDLGDRQLDLDLLAVGAQRRQLQPPSQHPLLAGVEETAHPRLVRRAHLRRDDHVGKQAPHHVGAGMSEGPLGRRVELEDAAIVTHGDDAVEGALDRGAHALLALAQAAFLLLALGDVVHGDHCTQQSAARRADLLAAAKHEPTRQVLRRDHHLDLAHRLAAQRAEQRYLLHLHRGDAVGVVKVVVGRPVLGLQRLLGQPMKLAGGLVEKRHDAVGIAGNDALGQAVERDLQEFPLLLKHRLRLLALRDVLEGALHAHHLALGVEHGPAQGTHPDLVAAGG